MKNIDRVFVTLSNIFFALNELPDGCPDDELVKAFSGIKGYTKLALNRVCEMLTSV